MSFLLESEENKFKKDMSSETKELIEIISRYNTADFILSVSALMLFPQNQSKTIIFQSMINAALTLPVENSKLENMMSINTFKKIVNRFEKTSISLMVDPPEFPFVYPVLYFNNPYVFMGNNCLSPIYLNNLLKIFELNKKNIDDDMYDYVRRIVTGLLSLSNEIFKSLDIKLDELEYCSTENPIFVPDKKKLDSFKDSLIISEKRLKFVFGDSFVDYLTLAKSTNNEDIFCVDCPKFVYKPFFNFFDSYFLIDITSILPFLFRFVVNKIYNVKGRNLIFDYNKLNSFELSERFYMMGCVLFSVPDLLKDNNYEENIYLLGNDDYIINIQLFDDGRDLPLSDNDTVMLDKPKAFINKRIDLLSEMIISKGGCKDKIYVIITPYTLGRYFLYKIKNDKNIFVFSLYELYAISINESNNKFFLKEYFDSKMCLEHCEKNLFSELNLVSFFKINGNSFYTSDDVDIKKTIFQLIGEYSSDYILKSLIQENRKLCNYYIGNSFIEVNKIDNCIFFSKDLIHSKVLNKVIVDDNSTIWIISNDNYFNYYDVFNWFSDLISFWLCELLPFNCENHNITIELLFDKELENGIFFKPVSDDISELLKYTVMNNVIKVYVNNDLCNFFTCDTNDREKSFIDYLLKIFIKYFSFVYDKDKFSDIFSNSYRKKTISIDSINNAYMIPSKSRDENCVSITYENMILDEIGLFLKNDEKYGYGVIDDKDVLNKVVDYLYNRLTNDLKQYSKKELITYLYEMYDKNIGNMLIRIHNYAHDISCYPNRKKDIEDNINNKTKLSIALRFVIELVSSYNNYGNKSISYSDLNYDIAIASHIIGWAYINDLLYYDMINSEISLLRSNRIGFDKKEMNRINLIMKKSMIMKNSVVGLEKQKRILQFLPEVKKIQEKDDFEFAFKSEFGYSYSDFTEVTITILDLFQEKYDNLIEFSINDVEENVQKDVSKVVIKKILDSLSLCEREDYLKPPKPYRREDVYPWRFNRCLSLLRKPLIKYNDFYMTCYRSVINSVGYLLDLIGDGRLKSFSNEMTVYESKINNIKGEYFNDQVYNFFSDFDSLIVKKNVEKINKKSISDENNNTLGDIDVLYISISKKIIGVVETKCFNIARNYYELKNEYLKMFDDNNSKSFYVKHKRRVEWVEKHIDDVVNEYELPPIKWKVKDMFVVDDYIMSKKIFDVDVNIHTLRDLNEKCFY